MNVPVLRGAGIVLRPWAMGDLPTVLVAAQDPFIPLITTVPARGSEADCRAFIERQWQRANDRVGYSFAICLDDGPAIGHIGLWPAAAEPRRASTGYWVTSTARGAGIAGRALAVLTDWAHAHAGVERLQLYVEPWNTGSIRTAERCGFRREGLMRRWERVGDDLRDMYMYARLKADPTSRQFD